METFKGFSCNLGPMARQERRGGGGTPGTNMDSRDVIRAYTKSPEQDISQYSNPHNFQDLDPYLIQTTGIEIRLETRTG